MRGELSIGAYFCARLHPFREIAAAIIVIVVRNRHIKESPGSRRPLATDLLVNLWFSKRLRYCSAQEGLRLSLRPGNVTRYRRVQSGQNQSPGIGQGGLFLPGEMIDHLSILAIFPPGPAFDNMVPVFEFHDHLMFMTHSYAG